MIKTVLVLVHDDRQGRKGGVYGQTAKWVENNISDLFLELTVHRWDVKDITTLYGFPILKHIDAGINGRAYKPLA